MKKVLISMVLAITVIVSAVAQETVSKKLTEDTPVKIEINNESFNPKLYALVKGRSVKLGNISDGMEIVIPEGTAKLLAGKDAKPFDCSGLKIDDTLFVDVKNPSLSGLGMGITYVGSFVLGAGLGLCLVAAMDGNSSDAASFALKTVLPGTLITAAGFGINLRYRTTIRIK